ncbi:MAG: alpha/beta hydrolase [Fluviicola sp.]|nr:alpha/beta hydrolase [Fluviicola sp.]
MKKIGLLFSAILLVFTNFAQDFNGDWYGELAVGGMKLPLVFHIAKTEQGYTSTMDSPSQKAMGMTVDNTEINGDAVVFDLTSIGARYEGKLNAEQQLIGVFHQGGQSLDLVLYKPKSEEVVHTFVRTQLVSPPFPYYTEEVTFENKSAGITLAGTLSLPAKKGKFPVVVLISGSGPQDRNETILDHEPFAVIADYLTRNGVGVLRYDDRGVGKSTGNFGTATTTDFSTDAEAALNYLKQRKEVNKSKIGLIGHSEGGIIAPMVAARNKDVAFIIMLAGPGLPGAEILALQQALIARADGATEADIEKNAAISKGLFAIVAKEQDAAVTTQELKAYLEKELNALPDSLKNGSTEKMIAEILPGVDNPWMKEFIRYDPRPALRKVSCPVLALNGSKDLQVPAKENIAAIEKALNEGWIERGKKEKHIELCILDGLNHLFQECETGSPREYGEISQTFSPQALTKMLDWMRDQGIVK